jgi:Fic family protein
MPGAQNPGEDTIRRVRAEFLEMPGLKLTIPQAQRLWGVDRSTCEALIDELTASRFLSRTRDGAFVLRAAS